MGGGPIASQIANFTKFSPYFDNCIGALDGNHTSAVVEPELKVRFRDRKKIVFQKVPGVASFELTFAYALYG